MQEFSSCLYMSRPWREESRKNQIDKGLIAIQSQLYQIVTKLAESESSLIVSEMRSSEQTEMYIAEAGCIAVAVSQAENDHPTSHESMKVGIHERRDWRDRNKQVQDIKHIWIGYQRQV